MNAKDFLRTQTIPRLAVAIPDFPYFSLEAVRRDFKRHKMAVQSATLPRYLHDLTKVGAIFDAGRGWYSTLSPPFVLNREPVAELVQDVERRFPFLEFAVWSTSQVATYGHHLLSRFVTFVYSAKDAMESVADALRDLGYTVHQNPSRSQRGSNFRIEEKTIVARPWISGSPVEEKFATIEKILVDLFIEYDTLQLMDEHEFKRIRSNILRENRISFGTLVRYLERRDLTVDDFVGEKIN